MSNTQSASHAEAVDEQHIRQRLDTIAAAVDAYATSVLNEADLAASLREAMQYALLGGGKRLRPALACLACEAAGAAWQDAVPAGVAIEMIHAFSLVHDDLPAMDDDDLRRGRPTLHIHAGEAMAILSGDALLGFAFEILTGQPNGGGLCKELAIGTREMVSGQVLDTLGFDDEHETSPADRLERVHRLKTGALLRTAVRMGAVVADADDQLLMRLSDFGDAAGALFQAVDDLLDVEADEQELGKRTNKDEAAGKLTSITVLGIDGTRDRIRNLAEQADSLLRPLGAAASDLRGLSNMMANRRR